MMDFKEFQESIVQDMKDRTWGVNFDIQPVEKLQGQSYTGLSIQPQDGIMAATVNLEQMYTQMIDGMPYEQVVDNLVERTAEILDDMPQVNMNDLTNYEVMKEKLVVQVIPTERNQDMLQHIPHKDIEDMSLVYRMMMDHNESGTSSILVTNQIMASYGITQEQLHQDALDAAVINNPATFRNLQEVLCDLMGMPAEMMPPMDGPQLYVASVEGSVNGAGVIAYPDFMEQVADQLGGDFFVLPSSVHEVLVLPDDGNTDRSVLESMVRDVNATEVQLEDQLSDNVYHYDSQDKVFELASSYEQRMAIREAGMEYNAPSSDGQAVKDTMTVLLVEPNKYPEIKEIGTSLEDLQQAVGGNIEVMYPTVAQDICLIVNEEGKLNGLPLNREIKDDYDETMDIVAGSFLVTGVTEDSFCSLTNEQIDICEKAFHQPEAFVKMGKGVMAIPIPDEVVKEMDKERDRGPKEKVKPSKSQDVLS